MGKPPELARLHTYFFWLGNYWAAWSLAIFLFNPIGDIFDTNPDGVVASLCERLNTIHYWGWPPFNSVQCLVGIHAPLFALFAGLRHRLAAPAGLCLGSVYLLFVLFAVTNYSLNGDLPVSTNLARNVGVAIARIIGAVLWCLPAFLIMGRLEMLRKAGIAYQRQFFAPNTHFDFGGRRVNYRLVWWCSTCKRLIPWVVLLFAVCLFGNIAYDVAFIESYYINTPDFIVYSGVFAALGTLAGTLSVLSFCRMIPIVRRAMGAGFLMTAIGVALHLHKLTGHIEYSFLQGKLYVLNGIVAAALLHAVLLTNATFCLWRARLPDSISVADLKEVEGG